MSETIFVGIDLGTTNTTCSILRKTVDGQINCERLNIYQVDTIYNDRATFKEQTILRSKVFFGTDNHKVFCGDYKFDSSNPALGVSVQEIKMKMGDDLWSMRYGADILRPVHISAIILKTVHSSLKKYLGGLDKIQVVAITIPASFSSKMRRATLSAALLAGFDPAKIKLIDEPVAALFSSWNPVANQFLFTDNTPFMVYDIGGGTIDVTIMQLVTAQKRIKVLATSRFNDIGGRTFDVEIATHILQYLESISSLPENLRKLLSSDNKERDLFIRKLLHASEKIKIHLFSITIPPGFLYSGIKDLSKLIPLNMNKDVNLSDFLNLSEFNVEIKIPSVNLIGCLQKFFPENTTEENNAANPWNIWEPVFQAMTNYSHAVPSICYLVGGGRFFAPVKLELQQRYRVYEDLDAFYSVSEGAAKYIYLHAQGDWKIEERTTEKVFLKRKGNTYLEVLDANLSLPVKIPREKTFTEDSMRFNENSSHIILDFYQGDKIDDPFMHHLYTRKSSLAFPFINEANLEKVSTTIDENKNYNFYVFLKEKGETNSVVIKSKITDFSDPIESSKAQALIEKLKINS